jgi:hypothetical protein
MEEPKELDQVDLNNLIDPNAYGERASESQSIPALTYVWNRSISELRPETWSFEEFIREKLSYWA